ncbi:hypothetical protein B0H13DRAFT_1903524 [Mycena leptocephala]|nr:hypothetical protein B0H13DRAFT_1903524 [Mycena leptocephala]
MASIRLSKKLPPTSTNSERAALPHMHRLHNVWDSPPHAWTVDAPCRHHTQGIKHERKGHRDAPAVFPSTPVETRPNFAFAPARWAVDLLVGATCIPSTRSPHGHESKRNASDPLRRPPPPNGGQRRALGDGWRERKWEEPNKDKERRAWREEVKTIVASAGHVPFIGSGNFDGARVVPARRTPPPAKIVQIVARDRAGGGTETVPAVGVRPFRGVLAQVVFVGGVVCGGRGREVVPVKRGVIRGVGVGGAGLAVVVVGVVVVAERDGISGQSHQSGRRRRRSLPTSRCRC